MSGNEVVKAGGRSDSLVAPSQAATSVIARLAERFGVDPAKMTECLKATAFKGGCTNEQLMALCIVADQYKLNPWTREIYAFPDKNNGIVPVVGVDGWSRIINEHPQFDGVDFKDGGDYCECIIHRKDRARPVSVREYLSECARNTVPWQSHPKRMLRHKALIQCARLAFGFAGIYDPDEAERIAEADKVSAPPYGRKPGSTQLLAPKPHPTDAPAETIPTQPPPAETPADTVDGQAQGADDLPY